ncbi:MAG: TetR family transcriptional regulator [Myxococcota bacterium]
MPRRAGISPAQTREAILEAAIRLFAEGGVAAVSVRAIGAAAGVTLGAVHHHFPSKADLQEAAVARVDEEITRIALGLLAAFNPADPMPSLRRSVVVAIDAGTARKIMSAANQPKKTKSAFLKRFAVDAGGGSQVALEVSTLFDRKGLSAEQVDASFRSERFWSEVLGELGVRTDLTSIEVGKAKGRGARSAEVQLTLAGPVELSEGRTHRSHAVPAWFQEVDGAVVRTIL